MKLWIGLGALLLSSLASAREFAFKRSANPAELQKELGAAGFLVNAVMCSGQDCRIIMPNSETKNPTPVINAHVYSAPLRKSQIRRSQIAVLRGKLSAKTITTDERDALLELLIDELGVMQRTN
jgi:hypothetical protein